MIGGTAALITLALAVYFYLRRKKKSALKGASPTTEDKPEMYAGPVNQDIAGPVKPKNELQSQGTIQGRPLPLEKLPEKYSTTVEELDDHERQE